MHPDTLDPEPRAGVRSGLAFVVAGGLLAFAAPVVGAIAVSLVIIAVLLFGRRRDAVTIVGAMFVLFVGVPTRFSFVGFGPLTPGMVVGSLALLWWLGARMRGRAGLSRRLSPIHALMVVLLAGAAIGFATMFTHPVTGEQFVGAHRSPLILAMFVGITLLVADGIATRRRLDDLIEILVLCVGALAVCGLVEQVTGDRLFSGKILPLLTENPSQLTITPRNGFIRIAGTAKHPLEFAVVIAATIPLTLHAALHGRPAFRGTAKFLLVVMAVALPLAISRSGIIGAAVGLLVMSIGWSWRRRASVLLAALALVAGFAVAQPRLVDTMSDLFVNVSEDTSTEARTRDYRVLEDVLAESPVFGRGLGAYNVVDYEVFDNQYLVSIVDGGYLGLGIQLLAFVVPIGMAWSINRRARDRSTAHLARASAASLAVLGVTWAFFDGAGYRIATALVFTMTGLVGVLWRFETDRREAGEPVAPTPLVPIGAWGSAPVAWADLDGPWRPSPLPALTPATALSSRSAAPASGHQPSPFPVSPSASPQPVRSASAAPPSPSAPWPASRPSPSAPWPASRPSPSAPWPASRPSPSLQSPSLPSTPVASPEERSMSVPVPDPPPEPMPSPVPEPLPVPEPDPAPVRMSVIIPAHDEELVIDRCLRTLFSDARTGELDVVVAANGCTDATIERARAWPVRVLDIPVASKTVALNHGDDAAECFPRFYVDADVQVTAGALREAAALLEAGEAKAASPTMRLDLRGCTKPVKAYYRVWRQLPYCSAGDLVGSGVYGVSERGYRHLDRFPEVIADDLWFRNRFRPSERRAVETATFLQQPPRDLRSLLRVRTRQVLGNLEFRSRFGHFGAPTGANVGTGTRGRVGLARLLLRPGAVTGAPVYLVVNALARRAARRRWDEGAMQWDADRSARLRSATT